MKTGRGNGAQRWRIFRGIIVLSIVTAISGLLLARAYRITAPVIEKQKQREQREVYGRLFPDARTFEERESNGTKYVAALDTAGEFLGRITEVRTLGYNGYMTLLVGVDANGAVQGVEVLRHGETPGLGSKATGHAFLSRFRGLKRSEIFLKKDRAEGHIDAVTGATISSRAVTTGVRNALDELDPTGRSE